jgi:hypothetical protein
MRNRSERRNTDMRNRSGPKTGEVTAIFGLPSFRPEWALRGITYPPRNYRKLNRPRYPSFRLRIGTAGFFRSAAQWCALGLVTNATCRSFRFASIVRVFYTGLRELSVFKQVRTFVAHRGGTKKYPAPESVALV